MFSCGKHGKSYRVSRERPLLPWARVFMTNKIMHPQPNIKPYFRWIIMTNKAWLDVSSLQLVKILNVSSVIIPLDEQVVIKHG